MKLQINRKSFMGPDREESEVLPVRRFVGSALALTLMLGTVASARADDHASLQKELETLRSKIEQIDRQITETAQGSSAIKDEADAYTAKVKANTAVGAALKEHGQQLASRLAQLDTEHAAAEQACHKTTATTQEYEAALAECEKARKAYQQHADEYRAEQQRLSADDTAYHNTAKDLLAEYKDIEKKRQDLLAQQASLHTEREDTLSRFNQVRDRLTALQPGVKPSPASAPQPGPK